MLQIVRTDADQPFLARQMAENGEEIWRSSENYTDRTGARRAIELLTEEFGLTPDGWAYIDTPVAVLRALDRDGTPLHFEVDVLDERTGGEG